jgi:DMSO/TMAO reductase YedYZ molybdopterin-dependent catalytic subunit
MRRIGGVCAVIAAVLLLGFVAAAQNAGELSVTGAVPKELHLSLADLKKIAHTSVKGTDHNGAAHTYDGVALQELLGQAGAPHGDGLRGKNMALVVVAEASDGYKAAFTLTELDADFGNLQVLVADAADGKALGEKEGPVRLVVPSDKRQARWVRMLTTVKVVSLE